MKKIIPILAIFSVIFTFFVLTPISITHAGGFLDMDNQEGFKDGEIDSAFGESGSPIDIRNFVANLIKAVLGLLGIIFLVLLVVAGYKYMMSQGNEEITGKAVEQITQAIIGLIIILSAYAITVFVIELVENGSDDLFIF